MKKLFTKEVKIGIATTICLVLLYIGINYLKGINLFKPANYYYVLCSNVRDITVSSPVFVDGFKVGLVRNIEYDYSTVDKIMLEIRLDKAMRINAGSYVLIESTLLSGSQLNLMLNKYTSEYLKPGDTLEGKFADGLMTKVETGIMPGITDLLPKIDSILTGLQILINSQELKRSFIHLENASEQLEETSRNLNRILKNDITEITSNLKTTTSDLSTFSRDLTRLDLNSSVNSLNSTLGNINEFSLKLNARDNSVGLLLSDTTLYRRLNFTLESANGLLIDIRQNPRKYINLSLF